MKRILILCLLATSFLLVSPILIKAQNTETVTISTYYPSPMGVYKNLRLFPISAAQAPLCDAVHKDNEGIMYYNNDAGQNQLMVCRETAPGVFGWQAVGASFWTQAGNSLYPNDTNWNVGIGTTSPVYPLHLVRSSGDAVLVTGSGKANEQGVFGWSSSGFAYIQGGIWGATTPNLVLQGGGGNVGIETVSPQQTLDVNGTTITNAFVIRKGTPSSPQEGQIWLQ